MNPIRYIIYVGLSFCTWLAFAGCEDEIDLPACIQQRIDELEANHCDTSANIMQYWFQQDLVYRIDPGNCADDQSYDVLDSNCEVIGRLEGFAGNAIINGVNFYENAELVSVVWKL